jgi:hypothetical protein
MQCLQANGLVCGLKMTYRNARGDLQLRIHSRLRRNSVQDASASRLAWRCRVMAR